MQVKDAFLTHVNTAPERRNEPNDLAKTHPHLWAFLSFMGIPGKVEPIPGEMKIEPNGAFWKVTLISNAAWLKKTFWCRDLTKLLDDAELAILDGSVPPERYVSRRQRKDPEKISLNGT